MKSVWWGVSGHGMNVYHMHYEECVVGGEWAWDGCVPHAWCMLMGGEDTKLGGIWGGWDSKDIELVGILEQD